MATDFFAGGRRNQANAALDAKCSEWHLTLKAFVGEYWAVAYHFLISGGET